jgi:hypothetical protein
LPRLAPLAPRRRPAFRPPPPTSTLHPPSTSLSSDPITMCLHV